MFFSNRSCLYVMLILISLKFFGNFINYDQHIFFVLSKVPYSICLSSVIAILMFYENSFNKLIKVFSFRNAPLFYLVLTFSIFALGLSSANKLLPITMSFLVVASIVTKDFSLRSSFNKPIFVSLGKVSYGMYLLHMLCANVVKKTFLIVGINLTPVIYFLITLIFSYFVSLVSFNTFEKYFLNLKKHFVV